MLLLDLKLPDADGVDILARVRKDHPELQTIIVTGFANVQSAIDSDAARRLRLPDQAPELRGARRCASRRPARRRCSSARTAACASRSSATSSSDILTRSPALQKVLRTLEKVAAARTPVLIEGESGVGKELLAQHLHRLSPRGAKAFVDLNCAAVPATLLESELFGHERGAFTGAANEKPGLVEVADGGTLFLDEVGEMAPEIQSKFLRVLDSGHVLPGRRDAQAAGRLPPGGATNRDLTAEVAAGRFRKDLFYRVNGVQVVIPPLRERPEDIPLLVEHFAQRCPSQKRFSPEALAALGDVRLAGQRARAALRGRARGPAGRGRHDRRRGPAAGDRRETGRVSVSMPASAPNVARTRRPPTTATATTTTSGPASAVRAALEKAKWRREKAAEILGVSPRTLYRWIKRLGL